jgi:hypothetical protein
VNLQITLPHQHPITGSALSSLFSCCSWCLANSRSSFKTYFRKPLLTAFDKSYATSLHFIILQTLFYQRISYCLLKFSSYSWFSN